jgi:hypothetical protein
LGYGRSVQEAFALGRVQIDMAGLGDAAALHLTGDNAGQLRFVTSEQTDKPVTPLAPVASTREPVFMAATAPGNAGSPPTIAKRQFSFVAKTQLAEALLACPTMANRQKRETVINDLPDAIKSNIQRSDTDRFDVVNLITTVLNYANGMDELLAILRYYEGNSVGMQSVEQLFDIHKSS